MTKYEKELEAWKDFELDYLIEEQEKPLQIIDLDWETHIIEWEYGECDDD